MTQVGTIRSLYRYPVKSMGGQTRSEVRVEPLGIAGDRLYALRDERAREIRGAKRWPVLMQCDARFDVEPSTGSIPSVTITLPDGSSTNSEVELRCTLPTPRCSMVMHAQPGLPREPSVLRAIVKDSEQNMGMYASVSRPGLLREGDPVELLPG